MMYLKRLNVLYLVYEDQDAEIILQRLEIDFDCPVILDTADTYTEFFKKFRSNTYDVILADYSWSGYAMAALRHTRSKYTEVPFIFVSGPIGEDTAVELLKQGAADYVFKNRLGRLSFAIERAIKLAKEKAIRVRTEASLRESQRLACLGNWDWDLINDETYWSDEMYRVMGYEPQSFLPNIQMFLNRIPYENRNMVDKEIKDALDDKRSFIIEHDIMKPDGNRRTARTRGYAQYNEIGDPIRMIGISQDISESKILEKELHESHHLFKQVIDNAPISILWKDTNLKFKGYNKNMATLMGVSQEEAIGKSNQELHLPELAEMYSKDDNDIILSLKPKLNYEERLVSAAGEELTVRTSKIPIFHDDGSTYGILAVIQDITKQKGVEQELLIAKENMEEAQRISHLGSWEWSIIENKHFWSDEFYRIHGLKPQSIKPDYELLYKYIHPDDIQNVNITMNKLRIGKDASELEYRVMRSDGCIRNVKMKGQLSFNQSGKLTKIFGTLLDITDRKKAEEEVRRNAELRREAEMLRKKEQEYLEILDGSTEGSWIIDCQNGTIEYSLQWSKSIGYEIIPTKERFKFAETSIHPEDRERVIKDRKLVFQKRLPKSKIEYRLKTVDRGYIWVLAQGKITYDENGHPAKIYGTSMDITDRKAMEEKLKRTVEELYQKNKLITEFFTNISHEFKTPLSIILMQLELMNLYRHDEVKMQELIGAATQNCYRLARLVGNILDISKMDAGFMKARLVRTDMIALIRDICGTVDSYVKTKFIQFSFTTTLISKPMATDVEKIERILLNLLSNAIKHTDRDGEIVVCVSERQDGGIIIAVEDTGEGIPVDKQVVIFDRFAQVDTSFSRQNGGTGIGLTLVKSLVELLKGGISVQSELGKGSKFIIELPLIEMNSDIHVIELRAFSLDKKVEMELSDLYLNA